MTAPPPLAGSLPPDEAPQRAARMTVGQKMAIIFLMFFALSAGSLILTETLYNGVADASRLVNESGKLRYLSQRLAFYVAESAIRKRANDEIPALMRHFDDTLAGVERDSSRLHPLLLRESSALPGQIGAVRDGWQAFRTTLTHALAEPALEPEKLSRLNRESDILLERADHAVSTLTQAAQRTHRRIDWLIGAVLGFNLVFLALLFTYVHWRIVTPLVEVTGLMKRFAAGERELRARNHRYDEIGDLMRGFNQSADQVQRYIGELRKLSQAVEQSANTIVITDRNGKVEYVNPYFYSLTGYAPEDVLGHNPRVWQSGNTNLEQYQQLWQTILSGKTWRGELLNRKKNGELYWETATISPVKNESGDITHFVGIKNDITARKLAEEKLHLWQRALESSVNAITITDAGQPDAPYVYVNPAFERITGYRAEEVLGRNGRFLQGRDTDQPDLENIRRAVREQRDGKALLRNYRKDGSLFWNELYISPVRNEKGDVTHYIGIQNDVTERMRYEEQLAYQAAHDTLTRLPNRNLAQDRLAQGIIFARRSNQLLALLFIDLDNFKAINESLGHNQGDLLLQIMAQRIGGCLRSGDTAARLGGDDFLVILTGVSREEVVSQVAHKILDAISEPVIVDGHQFSITCSIGISLFPRDGDDGSILLRNADAAMYRAKEQGHNSILYYTAEINSRVFQRLMLENSLRTALERGEFSLHYQPQVSLANGQMTGMEALLRWRHTELGMISPANFIPLAEESGLIVPIGAWVLHTACKQAKAWQDAGLPQLTVAVNLSGRQFRENIPLLVAQALAESGLQAQYLDLEITESVAMQHASSTEETLTTLRSMGVRLSIDDFGTGYSSLSYLKRFPINKLKLDQSFVRDIISDPDDEAISAAVIGLAHSLKLEVIAEGVETENQLEFLLAHQCDAIQGYLFSRPLPAPEMEQLLRDRRSLPVSAGSRL